MLRDARAACDYAFIVCFEGLSMMRYKDPKLAYGLGEGIGWINKDMSYDKDIFIRQKHHRPTRLTLVEKLKDILED